MNDCIFCKIVNGDIPGKIVYEDDRVLAFHDIDPKAPVHVLIIPKEHIPSFNEVTLSHKDLMGHISIKVPEIAREMGIHEDGYRVIVNIGRDGGQAVGHIHYHIIGGRKLQWPPG